MRAWAKLVFALEAPSKSGGTLGDHYRAAQRQGRKVPQLQIPPMPPMLHFVFPVFRQLSIRRPFTQGHPLPVPPSEIQAWCVLNQCRLKAWELELFDILDTTWLEAMRAEETPI